MNLTAAQARTRFAGARVARLATVGADAAPHIVPVTFALGGALGEPLGDGRAPDGDTLYFAVDHKPKRSTDLRRLRNIAADPRVSLLADHYADDWAQLWWARADGVAQIVADGAARGAGLALLCGKYAQYADFPPRGPVVAVDVRSWTGWAFTG